MASNDTENSTQQNAGVHVPSEVVKQMQKEGTLANQSRNITAGVPLRSIEDRLPADVVAQLKKNGTYSAVASRKDEPGSQTPLFRGGVKIESDDSLVDAQPRGTRRSTNADKVIMSGDTLTEAFGDSVPRRGKAREANALSTSGTKWSKYIKYGGIGLGVLVLVGAVMGSERLSEFFANTPVLGALFNGVSGIKAAIGLSGVKLRSFTGKFVSARTFASRLHHLQTLKKDVIMRMDHGAGLYKVTDAHFGPKSIAVILDDNYVVILTGYVDSNRASGKLMDYEKYREDAAFWTVSQEVTIELGVGEDVD